MKLHYLEMYLTICELLNKEPTFKGLKKFGKEVKENVGNSHKKKCSVLPG